MRDGRAACSRFQVLSEGGPAWAGDGNSIYYYDGLRFWRSSPRRDWKLRASWQTPSYGWTRPRQELMMVPALQPAQEPQEMRLSA